MMNLDLSSLLQDWPYESGKINVRLIRGDEDEPVIQVRLDLGILQMQAEGRPDGQRPFGFGSYLEYLEARRDGDVPEMPLPGADPAEAPDPEPAPDHEAGLHDRDPAEEPDLGGERPDGEFELTEDECRLLREEAVQFYHRYIALLVLEDFEGVLRDTGRNLRVLDFCAHHGPTDDDRESLEQFRPYIVMMRSRALASQLLADDEPKAALFAVDEGLAELRKMYEDADQAEAFAESSEAQMLRSMRESLLPKLPVSQTAELKQRIEEAVTKENYELAAILRDELRAATEAGQLPEGKGAKKPPMGPPGNLPGPDGGSLGFGGGMA